jgi:predicted lipoprotein with Yx(FWY)xxD motif
MHIALLSILLALGTAVVDPTMPVSGTVGTQAVWMSPGGLALYVSDADAAGVSNCTADCAHVWPPLAASSTAVATGDFTIITRKDPAGLQWAYRGKPLYTFGPDKPGDPRGDGQGGFTYATIAPAAVPTAK